MFSPLISRWLNIKCSEDRGFANEKIQVVRLNSVSTVNTLYHAHNTINTFSVKIFSNNTHWTVNVCVWPISRTSKSPKIWFISSYIIYLHNVTRGKRALCSHVALPVNRFRHAWKPKFCEAVGTKYWLRRCVWTITLAKKHNLDRI